jgi:hypothetical protein
VPVFTIQAPDGRQIDIEAADEAIAMRGAQEWAQANPAKDTRPKSQALGFLKGIMKPADNAAIAIEKAAGAMGVPTDKINNIFGTPDSVTMKANRERAFAEAPQRAGAVGEIAGNVVGTIPAAMASKNPFVQGALAGAALTDAKTPVGVGIDMATGAGLNYLGGKAVDAVSDVIAPVIDPAVRRLKDLGLKMTPGMVKGGKALTKETRAMRRPVVGDAIAEGREAALESASPAAANRVLAPLGVRVPSTVKPGGPTVAYAKGEVTRAYDLVIPNVAVRLNGQQFAQSVMPAAQNLKAGQQRQLRQIVSNELGNGQLAGDALKRAQGNIRRLAGKFSKAPDPNDNLLGDALWAVDDELSAAMIAQNPKWAPQLQKVNEAYHGYRIFADASSRSQGQIFTPAQMRQSTRRGDFSKSKDASARGEAFMQDFAGDLEAVLPGRPSAPATSLNPFAYGRGALDAVGYNADNLYQAFRLAPRGPAAKRTAQAVRRLKGPVAAGAVAAGSQPRN